MPIKKYLVNPVKGPGRAGKTIRDPSDLCHRDLHDAQ